MQKEDTFVVKDSGAREQHSTGAVRDTQVGKPRYDLIPALSLRRVAMVYSKGAEKYGDNNWLQGFKFTRLLASAMRHLFQWVLNERDEDHLGHCVFNLLAIMHFESSGRAPELDDIPLHKLTATRYDKTSTDNPHSVGTDHQSAQS